MITDVTRNHLISKRLRQKYCFVESVWVVPLMNGERAVCVGCAIQREAPSEELWFLQLLGDQADLAIERARLTRELREIEARLEAIFCPPPFLS